MNTRLAPDALAIEIAKPPMSRRNIEESVFGDIVRDGTTLLVFLRHFG